MKKYAINNNIKFKNNNPSINEVIDYIKSLVINVDLAISKGNDKNIGYQIASIMSLENSDELCDDKDLDDLISIAGVLEIPTANIESRKRSWEEILSLLSKLEEKYKS